ncbi:hypothetical protein [Aquiflexum lacus]|uniref:hypothetical protein n=1 Tax=Aquiflexum lacus TaxID=2483805 RepID=UPI0018957670|nr:hypothetical protein [Aquiflexum lacus]
MSRFFALFILTALIVFFIGPYFPFWGIMIIVASLAYLLGASPATSFFSSGLSFGLVWLALSIWISIDSGSELPIKMAELMGLSNDNLLWLATGLIGFMIGAFSGLTGSLFKKVFEKRDQGIYKSHM